jgi:hypothetical protein
MKKINLCILYVLIGVSCFAQSDSLKTKEVGLLFSNINNFGLCFKTGSANTLFRISALTSTGSDVTSNYNSYVNNGVTDVVPAAPVSSYGVGINFGIERRKHINPRAYFYYGLLLISSYSTSSTNTITPTNNSVSYFNTNNEYVTQNTVVNNSTLTKTWSVNAGLGFLIGIAYKFGHSFSIGAELAPSVTYNDAETTIQATTYNVTWKANGGNPETLSTYAVNSNSDKVTNGISYSILNTNAAITIAYRIK